MCKYLRIKALDSSNPHDVGAVIKKVGVGMCDLDVVQGKGQRVWQIYQPEAKMTLGRDHGIH